MSLAEILVFSTPIVVSLVAGLKQVGFPSSWSWIPAIFIGVGIVTLATGYGGGPVVFNSQVVLFGIMSGLGACGLYSASSSSVASVKARVAYVKAVRLAKSPGSTEV